MTSGDHLPHLPTLSNRRNIPPRTPQDVVNRHRLTGIANLLTSYRMALVFAPAGCGKTTLLSQWYESLRSGSVASAWYSVSDDEKDPLGLADYLLLVLGQLTGTAKTSAVPSDRDEALQRLMATIEVIVTKGPFVLFIDDYHLAEQHDAAATISAILAKRFPQFALVLASRTRPTLTLGRYRANGEMLEISGQDLQFSDGETEDFFKSARGVVLSSDESRQMRKHTEGWAAGLRLASLVIGRTGGNFLMSAPAGSHRAFVDYFLEEVISGLPEDVCAFLADTSILETLGVDLCAAVTGRSDCAAILEGLEQAQLFVVALPGAQRWYKYHHLFQEFLQTRLYLSGMEKTVLLHRKAADWFIKASSPIDAVRHAFLAQQPKWAAELIERYCLYDYLSHGRFETYSRWMQQLPRDAREERPLLMFLLVWRYINTRRFLQAEQTLRIIEATCANPDSPSSVIARQSRLDIEGRLHLMRALMGAYGGDFARCRAHISALHNRELDRLAFGQVDFDSIHSYLAYHEGNLDLAERLTWKANGVYDDMACHWGGIHSRCIAAMSSLARGSPRDAEFVLNEALALGQSHFSEQSYMVALPSALLGQLAYEAGDLAKAERLWLLALPPEKTTDVSGLCERAFISVLGLARLFDATGRSEAAAALLVRFSRRAYEAEDFRLEFQLAIERTDRAFRLGNPASGRRERDRMLLQLKEAETRFPPSAWQIWEAFAKAEARSLALHGEIDRVEALLGRLSNRARDEERPASALLLDVLSWKLSGRADAAARQAFYDKAESMGLRRSIAEITEDPSSNDYPLETNQASEKAKILLPTHFNLTVREVSVLELMRSGLSNNEIADALGINLNTVKSHAKNIFEKLQVKNRTQAVLKALQI